MEYNLLEHQKEIVRQMVTIAMETKVHRFSLIPAYEKGNCVEFAMQRPTPTVRATAEDLQVLAHEDLIGLNVEYKHDLAIYNGSVKQSAIDAVKNDFKRPRSNPQSPIQNFYAAVGVVHTGPGNVSIGTQKVGLDGAELGRLMNQMQQALGKVRVEHQPEVKELLEELDAEMKSSQPKQSRIKSFIMSIRSITGDVAEFATNLAAIATAYGITKGAF